MRQMRRTFCALLIAPLLLTGCSSSAGTASTSSSAQPKLSASASLSDGPAHNAADTASTNNSKPSTSNISILATPAQTRKMVIYNADLTIQVKNFSSAQSQIEQLANSAGGYVLDSSVSDTDQTTQAGKLTLRIPHQQFEPFLNEVAKISTKVVSRTVTGEDVTQQYVDLESTLKAKQQVEDRLHSFMQSAKNTDDLLKISNTLTQVQQDIETIKGQMKYLEVNSDLSKVTINISENQAVIASVKDENSSVWGKTKTFFVDNLNWLVTILSQLFIFLVGASPTLICLAVLGWVAYRIWRKRQARNQSTANRDSSIPPRSNDM